MKLKYIKMEMDTVMVLVMVIVSSVTTTAIPTTTNHHRHLLHQPFMPLTTTVSPSQPPGNAPQQQPSIQTQPKFPFSTTPPNTPQRPFFPSVTSSPPPPPPVSSLATFPANISSLLFPHSPSPSSSRRIIITLSVSLSLLFVGILLAISAFCVYFRRSATKDEAKSDGISLFPPNTVHSDGSPKPPKLPHRPGVPNSNSSEFLYLGTLLGPSQTHTQPVPSNASGRVVGSSSSYQKLGSPELKPLPPLPKLSSGFTSGEVLIDKKDVEVEMEAEEEEEEEFFSPRGSSDRREFKDESTGRVGSSLRSDFRVQGENFGSRSFNSRTASYPYSNSISPVSSVVTSPALSANIVNSRSPDNIMSFVVQNQRNAGSVSSNSSSGNTLNSPERNDGSNVQYVAKKIPPPPPPLPPQRFWENHVVASGGKSGPQLLATPTKPIIEELNANGSVEKKEETPTKPKLKPLHWDKVRASSDRAMVWDQIKSSSFQLNEEMIESLFMVNNSNMGAVKDNNGRRQSFSPGGHDHRVLDPKKSQNIAILLRALNVTIDEVCEALMEGNTDSIGTELLESLLKMAPNKEEERKLQELKDDSPVKLGPAEKFLKAVIDIPFAFKRVEAMLYIANFDTEIEYIRRSFETLEAACQELRNSRMFLKLLDAVLKTGNRMNVGTNRGDARAFKLDTLLKLVDVKGADGKTTLLHFVVQEIIRSEGLHLSGLDKNQPEKIQQSAFQDEVEFRKLGLQVVSGLSGELSNVKKAAAMDSDVLCSEVAKLAAGIAKIKEVLQFNEGTVLIGTKFADSMNGFLKKAEEEIARLQAQEKIALALVKEVTEYFHGNLAQEEAHPFRIFVVVRDFLSVLDRVCKEVGKINDRIIYSSARPLPNVPTTMPVFPGLSSQHRVSFDENPTVLL